MPGQDTINYHICTGKFPLDQSAPVKKNYPVLVLGGSSLVIYVVAWVRIQVFKSKLRQQEAPHLGKHVSNSQTMYNFAANLVTLILILGCFWVPYRVNKFSANEITLFPNYLWVYFLHHGITGTTCAVTALFYFRDEYYKTFLLFQVTHGGKN